MNRNGEKPESLRSEPEPYVPEFVTAVGDDSISRFDAPKRKRSRGGKNRAKGRGGKEGAKEGVKEGAREGGSREGVKAQGGRNRQGGRKGGGQKPPKAEQTAE